MLLQDKIGPKTNFTLAAEDSDEMRGCNCIGECISSRGPTMDEVLSFTQKYLYPNIVVFEVLMERGACWM